MKKLFIIFLCVFALSASIFTACKKPTPPDKYIVTYDQPTEQDTTLTIEVGRQPSQEQIPDVEQKTGYDGAWEVVDFLCAKKDDTIVVKPVYTAKTFNVSFNSDGGSAVEDKSVTFGSPYVLSAPTKEGFIFEGWYALGDEGEQDKKVLIEGSKWDIPYSLTLTAKWQEKIYEQSVVFMQEGKDNVTFSVEKGSAFDVALVPQIEQKTGYTAMWKIDGEPADFTNLVVNQDVFVTLVYTPKTYTLVFKYDYIIDEATQERQNIDTLSAMSVTFGEQFSLPALDGINRHEAQGWLIDGELFDEQNLFGEAWDKDGDSQMIAVCKGAKIKLTFKQTGFSDVIRYVDYGGVIQESVFPEVQGLSSNEVGGWERSALITGTKAFSDREIKAVIVDKNYSPLA